MKADGKITQAAVKKFIRDTAGVGILWDRETRGFGLKYNAKTGAKSYLVKHGSTVRAFARADLMDLDDAREEAKARLLELGQGKDRDAVAAAERQAAEAAKQAA